MWIYPLPYTPSWRSAKLVKHRAALLLPTTRPSFLPFGLSECIFIVFGRPLRDATGRHASCFKGEKKKKKKKKKKKMFIYLPPL
jgi:hypothetical protein